MNNIKILPFLFAFISLSGCGINREKRAYDVYDFGLPAQSIKQTSVPASVQIQEISTPTWLATPALHYRLAYHDAARLQTYSNSRWAADPASLLTLRLRQAVGKVAHDNRQYQLHVGLEEFSQVFDTPEDSRGLIRAHASLMPVGESSPIAARTFTVERKAQSPNAEGGVRALTEASSALVDEIENWLIETTAEASKKK